MSWNISCMLDPMSKGKEIRFSLVSVQAGITKLPSCNKGWQEKDGSRITIIVFNQMIHLLSVCFGSFHLWHVELNCT